MLLHRLAGCFAAFFFAALSAAFVATIPFALVFKPNELAGVLLVAFGISLGHAIVLGLPLFVVLRWKGWVNLLSSTAGGFVIGAVGFFLLTIGMYGPRDSYSVDNIPHIVDGVRTAAGWLSYLTLLAYLGFHGAIAGFVFWCIAKWTGVARPVEGASQTASGRRSWLSAGFAVVLMLASGVVFSLTAPVQDRTCHNMSYDAARGPQMVTHGKGPVMKIDVAVGIGGWPTLIQLFQDFGAREQLAFRNSARDEFGEPRVLALSLCNERGANIEADTPPWAAGVGISIYQRREGADSIRLGKDLSAELERRWPGSVRFRDARGQVISAP